MDPVAQSTFYMLFTHQFEAHRNSCVWRWDLRKELNKREWFRPTLSSCGETLPSRAPSWTWVLSAPWVASCFPSKEFSLISGADSDLPAGCSSDDGRGRQG